MKRGSKILLFTFVTAASLFINIKNVNAQTESFYTNDKGVQFTEDQYNFITRFYWDGYQNYMTQEMLDDLSDIDFANVEVEKVSYCPIERGTFVSSQYKSLTIGRACGALCRVSVSAEWFVKPSIKSYDVMGMYLDGPTRNGTPTTIIAGDGEGSFEETIKYENDGFGAVIKLPNAEKIVITQSMVYNGSGRIYASYQHAMENISFANAQKFNIEFGGYGGVFEFYGGAYGVYDQFPGVDINV